MNSQSDVSSQPQQQHQKESDVVHVNWNRVIDKTIPFSIVGGVGGFIFATATARPTVLTPALWSGYAALSSGAFFALRDWFFTPSGIDNMEKLPVWKQLSTSILPGAATGSLIGAVSSRGPRAVATTALLGGLAAGGIHGLAIAWWRISPILFSQNEPPKKRSDEPQKAAASPNEVHPDWWKPVRKVNNEEYTQSLRNQLSLIEAEERLKELEHEARRKRVEERLERERKQQQQQQQAASSSS